MPVYEVLHDVSVPTGEVEEQPGGVRLAKYRDVPGDEGETVELDEATALPLVQQGILALPEQVERTRSVRREIAGAHETAAAARETAAQAEEEARAIEERGREQARRRMKEGS